jgi:predicted small metal-binding protein
MKMSSDLKKIECGPTCGFVVQSHDEKEVLEIAKKHAKDKHKMNATDQQLKGMMKKVEKEKMAA